MPLRIAFGAGGLALQGPYFLSGHGPCGLSVLLGRGPPPPLASFRGFKSRSRTLMSFLFFFFFSGITIFPLLGCLLMFAFYQGALRKPY
jgi:hypothetical protein